VEEVALGICNHVKLAREPGGRVVERVRKFSYEIFREGVQHCRGSKRPAVPVGLTDIFIIRGFGISVDYMDSFLIMFISLFLNSSNVISFTLFNELAE
jgi:hypothetical protein